MPLPVLFISLFPWAFMLQPGTWVEIRPGARLWPEMELNE